MFPFDMLAYLRQFMVPLSEKTTSLPEKQSFRSFLSLSIGCVVHCPVHLI